SCNPSTVFAGPGFPSGTPAPTIPIVIQNDLRWSQILIRWSQIPIWDHSTDDSHRHSERSSLVPDSHPGPQRRRFPSSCNPSTVFAGPGFPSGTTTSTIPIVIQNDRWSRIPIRDPTPTIPIVM
ncbi:MAG: hypothetical protein ACUVXJ_16145, partial [Phycisphaerae bacterium]